MLKTVRVSLMAAASALALMGAAQAGSQGGHQDVVKDVRGNVVMNSFGNCVLTKWTGAYDECSIVDIEARTVYFNFDSASLTPAARAKLDSLIDVINSAAEIESVNIIGYADMIGNSGYNKGLSMRRAQAVKQYLAKRGGIDTRNTELRALGDTVPVSNCPGMKGKALRDCLWRDRRVEIELNVVR